METNKTIKTRMIGIFDGLNSDGDYVLNHAVTLNDYNGGRLYGINIGNQKYFKYLDQTWNFLIKKSDLTDSSGKYLEDLKSGDSIIFDFEADIVEITKNYGCIKETYNTFDNIRISFIHICSMFDVIPKLKELVYSENKMIRYKFSNEKPVSDKDFDIILNSLTSDNASPEAIALYISCIALHNEEYIDKDDIELYLAYWNRQDIDKALFELSDLGYFLKAPIYELIDRQCLPEYLTDLDVLENRTPDKMSSEKVYVCTDILNTNSSPIAVGVYTACTEYNEDGCIDEEMLWNNTLWARQYIERGIEELEKLGYLVETNQYYELDGRKIKIYKFNERIINK